jgi:hypothetical protein
MTWLENHIGESVVAAVVAIMAFFGKRELKRIDEKANSKDMSALFTTLTAHIEEDRETKREIIAALSKMDQEAKDGRHALHEHLAEVLREQSATNVQVAAELGELRGAMKGMHS